MAIQTHNFHTSLREGTILECTNTGTVFGPIFDAPEDTVEQFLRYATLDALTLHNLGQLVESWEAFKEGYQCFDCGKGSIEHSDLTYESCCFAFHCAEHAGEEWSDGHQTYGHKC